MERNNFNKKSILILFFFIIFVFFFIYKGFFSDGNFYRDEYNKYLNEKYFENYSILNSNSNNNHKNYKKIPNEFFEIQNDLYMIQSLIQTVIDKNKQNINFINNDKNQSQINLTKFIEEDYKLSNDKLKSTINFLNEIKEKIIIIKDKYYNNNN